MIVPATAVCLGGTLACSGLSCTRRTCEGQGHSRTLRCAGGPGRRSGTSRMCGGRRGLCSALRRLLRGCCQSPGHCRTHGATSLSVLGYLSIPKSYSANFSVFPVDARCGNVDSHRGAPSRGLEWTRFEAASATDPAGRRTVHFPTTLPFSKPTLRMTPIYVISDISRWRECYAPGVGCC